MERNPTVWRKIEKQRNSKSIYLFERKRFSFNEPSSGL